MVRVILALLILLLMGFIAWRQHENPPPKGVQTNAVSDKVADVIAGNAVRAKQQSENVVDTVNQARMDQLHELDRFQRDLDNAKGD